MDVLESFKLTIGVIQNPDAPMDMRCDQLMVLFHFARANTRALMGVANDEEIAPELRALAKEQIEALSGAITEFLTMP